MPAESPNEFVIASTVRTAIVERLASGPTATGELLGEIAASESAVYDALSSLEQRGIARKPGGTWSLTAKGRIVADSIEPWQATESLLAGDPDYWQNHRIDVVPDPFRRRLPELGDYEVYRDGPGEPNRAEQVAVSRMANAESPSITTPFYSKNHQENVPNNPETRMLVTREATDISVQRYREGHREDFDDPVDFDETDETNLDDTDGTDLDETDAAD